MSHVAVGTVGGFPRLPRPRGPASASAGRDQYIDGLRALALVRVVTYHTFGWVWLPVAFPSMGVMFALGGSLVAGSLSRSPGRPLPVLRKRVRRLLPPLWLYGIVLVALMARQGWTYTTDTGSPLDWRGALAWVVPLEPPAGSVWGDDFVLPLWYIRTYLWLLLLSPGLLWLFRRYARMTLVAPAVLLAAIAAGFVPTTTAMGDTLDHLGMFGCCWLLGFAHHDGLIRRLPLARTLLGGAVLMAAGLVWAVTHQQIDTGWDIDNIDVADALYCAGAVLILLRLYPRARPFARLPWLGRLVAAMNARAMTIYLWGNLAIGAATPVLESNALTSRLEMPGWVGEFTQYVTAWVVLIGIVLAVGWAEDAAAGKQLRINPWPRRTGARRRPPRSSTVLLGLVAGGLVVTLVAASVTMPVPAAAAPRVYPVHLRVPASVVRIGAVGPAAGRAGQSLRSAWDGDWAGHYGGCDGYGPVGPGCRSDLADRRPPAWFPVHTLPRENPFYVGVPQDDPSLKNRWVRVDGPHGRCYAQVEDSGPGSSDPGYVQGAARPRSAPAINLSPALAACVGLDTSKQSLPLVDWSFVDQPPTGPWNAVVTTRPPDVGVAATRRML